jgi:hypothetical protein
MRCIFFAIIALVSASHADAEVPRFDAEGHCREVAGFGGSYSAEIFNFCVGQEQSAYNALKRDWSKYPAAAQNHCTQIASFAGPGSYEILKFCADQELEASANTKTFQY